ncbi:hypothetical protein JQX13_38955 [Archangium violaceum]|uniref:hypothetical protein n=1 Tax=Archangium violaceum TaxID=83451 RepID=UPI00193C5661|nr:hypothetical protein [Archangium violaceum]QRK06062.1 hypothetical protein JQX13_38955 [Archangium violaceum]
MRRLSLSSLAVLSLLSLSTPVLADTSSPSSTGADTVTAHLVQQAQATPRTVAPPAPQVVAGDEAPPSSEVGLGEWLKLVVQAVASRNWGLLACAVVLGAVFLVRKFLVGRVPWLASDVAGVALSMVTATVLSLVGALKTGTPLSLSLVLGAILTAAGASGLWSWGKKLTAAAKTSKVAARTALH